MTKILYLLRHAKSDWGDPSLPDRERPLNDRGRRATQTMAGHLRAEGINPQLVLCSSALRTRQTLDGVGEGFGEHAPRVDIEDGLYETTAGAMLDRVREIAEDVASAMLIGHNPATHDLAVLLCASGPQLERMLRKFPTTALATLEIEGSWADLNPGGATLAAFVAPSDLA
jgi:phosphohistidine phosphatase